jgi:hypothetical protein
VCKNVNAIAWSIVHGMKRIPLWKITEGILISLRIRKFGHFLGFDGCHLH